MPNPSAQPQSKLRRAGKGYERRDANAKWIFGIVLFLLIAGLIMHFVLAGMMERLAKTPYPTDAWNGTRRGPQSVVAPRLQIVPAADLASFRSREEAELNSYGWINRTAGVVRIPIERAMELVLERGLPTRAQTNAPATGPSTYQLQQQRAQSPQPEIKEAP